MTFSDLAWEEKGQSRSQQRRSFLDFEQRVDGDFISDLPDWREVRAPASPSIARFEWFDALTIAGYFGIASMLLALAVFSLSSDEGTGVFLEVVGALLAIFFAVGRIIEVRWRGRHDP